MQDQSVTRESPTYPPPPDPEKTKPAATGIADGLSEYRGGRLHNVTQSARRPQGGAS